MREFERCFDEEYGSNRWNQVQKKIDDMIRSVFAGTASILHTDQKHPLDGQLLHPNAGWSLNQPNTCPARAMYGIDILLRREKGPEVGGGGVADNLRIEPTLLEIQWGADANKALEFHPSFWDDVLEYLYLDSNEAQCMVEL